MAVEWQLADLDFLISPEGAAALAELGNVAVDEASHLGLATRLRQRFSPRQTQALLETALLRQKGSDKFERAGEMFFTRSGLEQASGETISRYRGKRYAQAGKRHVADMGCGIGGDGLGLLTAVPGLHLTGIDQDPIRLRMAQENCRAYEVGSRFSPLEADLLQLIPPPQADSFFFDPARRTTSGRRIHSVQAYRPPLALLERWREEIPDGAAKISPGVDYAELPERAEAEFISLAGEVKECLLWFGELGSAVQRRATLLPSGDSLVSSPVPPPLPILPPQRYLYEPNGAVIRAHLVQELGEQLGAGLLDPHIAYLTGDELVETPFATPFEISDSFPFQLKRLRAYLRERHVGQVVIKKRGSPLDPDQLRRQLRLKGNGERSALIFLTRIGNDPFVLMGNRIESEKRTV